MIRIGVAGWSYQDWKGIAYPKPASRGFDPLAWLAAYLDVVEVNTTFYRPSPAEWARKWVERVSGHPDFRFTVKLWRRFTHQRSEGAWGSADEDAARAALEPLADAGRLGAVLAQFPWSFRRSEENRAWLEDVVSAFEDYPLVVEVRHASWNVPEFYRDAGARGVGFVNIDQPLFRDSLTPSARSTTRVGYIRLHGRNYSDWFREASGRDERYDYLYTPAELEPWADRARSLDGDEGTEEVYVVANNHYRAQSVVNAVMLRSMVEGEAVPAPPPLFDHYGQILAGYAHPTEPAPA